MRRTSRFHIAVLALAAATSFASISIAQTKNAKSHPATTTDQAALETKTGLPSSKPSIEVTKEVSSEGQTVRVENNANGNEIMATTTPSGKSVTVEKNGREITATSTAEEKTVSGSQGHEITVPVQ